MKARSKFEGKTYRVEGFTEWNNVNTTDRNQDGDRVRLGQLPPCVCVCLCCARARVCVCKWAWVYVCALTHASCITTSCEWPWSESLTDEGPCVISVGHSGRARVL
jgi:hypothetical protein